MSKLTLIEREERVIDGVIIKGAKWTKEALIITALVNRLGGRVTIHSSEIKEAGGLVIQDKGEGVYIETNEYNEETY
ncbi:MAG: hypothetical protein ABUK08_00370 [Candidatus Humimicrobiaceae bacterium]